MRDTFLSALTELAYRDERIVLLTGDLGFKVLDPFREQFPDRFVNVGVAEANMAGIAAGLAKEGLRPVTYSIGNFPSLRALEQIRLNICYHEVPVIVVAVGAGFSYGSLGVSHHATDDLGAMRSLPNLYVFSPCDLDEVRCLTPQLFALDRPVYFRLDKSAAPSAPLIPVNLRDWRTVRPGTGVALLAQGGVRAEAESAAQRLATLGVNSRVVSCPLLSKCDPAMIARHLDGCDRVITIEEHQVVGGLGSLVAETIAEQGLAVQLVRMGLRDQFAHEVGSQEHLRATYGLDAAAIVRTVLNVVKADSVTGPGR
jgi:transketolase